MRILTVLFCLVLVACYEPKTILVEGRASVKTDPDYITVGAQLVSSGETPALAAQQSARRSDELIERIAELDIATADVVVPSYELARECKYDSEIRASVCSGYRGEQPVIVKTRDQEKLGLVLAVLGEAGVDYIAYQKPVLESEQEELLSARQSAIDDARERADTYATSVGLAVTGVLGIEDRNAAASYYSDYRLNDELMAELGFTPPSGPRRNQIRIATLKHETTASVFVQFQLGLAPKSE